MRSLSSNGPRALTLPDIVTIALLYYAAVYCRAQCVYIGAKVNHPQLVADSSIKTEINKA